MLALAGLVAIVACGCAAQVRSSRTENEARLSVPIPVCVVPLPRRAAPGGVVSLTATEYWQLLLPTFDPTDQRIDPSAPDCSGRGSLRALSSGGSTSLVVDAESAVIAPAADAMKIVWLKSHPAADGGAGGLLALTRQRDNFLEVYAVGTHRSRSASTTFVLERMGYRLVVTAVEEHCRGEGERRRCSSTCEAYLLGTGQLHAAARYPLDRSVVAAASGARTQAEYLFSASAAYESGGIRLTEHLSVTDPAQGEILTSDLERLLALQGNTLKPSEESLWDRTLRTLELPAESP